MTGMMTNSRSQALTLCENAIDDGALFRLLAVEFLSISLKNLSALVTGVRERFVFYFGSPYGGLPKRIWRGILKMEIFLS